MRQDRDRRKTSRSRSDSRPRRDKHRMKSHERRKSKSREGKPSRRRRDSRDDDHSKRNTKRDRREDPLSKIAASISEKILQRESKDLEEVEKALDIENSNEHQKIDRIQDQKSVERSVERSVGNSVEDDEKKRRKERLRLWQKKQEQTKAHSSTQNPTLPQATQIPKISLNKTRSKKPKRALVDETIIESEANENVRTQEPINDTTTATTTNITTEIIPPPPTTTITEEGKTTTITTEELATTTTLTTNVDVVDPLDAFMHTLQTCTEIVEQDPVTNDELELAEGREKGRRLNINPFGSNTISLDEILQSGKQPIETWESDVDGEENTQKSYEYDFEMTSPSQTGQAIADREGIEEEERQSFIEALLRQREEEEKRMAALMAADKEKQKEKGEENIGRLWADDGNVTEAAQNVQAEKDALTLLAEQTKKKELAPVDHSKIDYLSVRKNLYIVPKALASLTSEEVQKRRIELEIKIRGKGCPPPIETWEQCGLRDRILSIINRCGFGSPFAIQRQAIPALMSGRDVIGVARTGSGKTLAFLLPMIRHILDQPPLAEGEGPIGLIMAPARELVTQIYSEAKKFTKLLGLRVTAVYGGAGVADQIGDIKRGADIIVCTPGRMIDILAMQAGKLVSFKRVSFVVMDEADRMFDMGFEPQIKMILKNIRPDKQTALFSATFPPKVESLARKVLKSPLEIAVGGRSHASEAIVQYVEVREEDDKFMRLLQLLGIWYERGNVLVFVDTQQKADSLFQDLSKSGYPALSLHGGKEQIDRDCTISDFKSKIQTLMVATSVAGRGLDVPDLVCVINYSCPNHLEDYVHRVGRTGRAGRSGTAYTFISPQEESHAPTLVKALEGANQVVPAELQRMADEFNMKVSVGTAKKASSGFSGKGFTFDDSEMTEAQKIRSIEKRQYEIEAGLRSANDVLDSEADENGSEFGNGAAETTFAQSKAMANINIASQNMALNQAKLIAQQLSLGGKGGGSGSFFQEYIDINEYPQQARWKVTQTESIGLIEDNNGVAVVRKGMFCPPGKKLQSGEEKLHLRVEGTNLMSVLNAKNEILRLLNEETLRSVGHQSSGKYQVV